MTRSGEPDRLVVAITGATGAIYGIRLLEALRDTPVESHLVVSDWGMKTISIETTYRPAEVLALADRRYRADNLAAPISSGSFRTRGMVIAPCSMKTLSAIACGYGDNLVSRAAAVSLKERRKLILLARESPLSMIDLENMLRVSRAGAVVAPPEPAFYTRPATVGELVDQSVGRLLDQLEVEHALLRRWPLKAQEDERARVEDDVACPPVVAPAGH